MIKLFSSFIFLAAAVFALDIKCYDIGDVSGNHIYESHENGDKVIYQCKKTISHCKQLKQNSCSRLSSDIIKYMRFVEITQGFLTTQTCWDEGVFHDCPLMEYHDNKLPLLIVDAKGHAHKLDLQSINASMIDKLILKRNITVQGHYIGESELIKVDKIFQSVKAYIPKKF